MVWFELFLFAILPAIAMGLCLGHRKEARDNAPRALPAPPVFRVPEVPPPHISRPRAIIVDPKGQAVMPPTVQELLEKYGDH